MNIEGELGVDYFEIPDRFETDKLEKYKKPNIWNILIYKSDKNNVRNWLRCRKWVNYLKTEVSPHIILNTLQFNNYYQKKKYNWIWDENKKMFIDYYQYMFNLTHIDFKCICCDTPIKSKIGVIKTSNLQCKECKIKNQIKAVETLEKTLRTLEFIEICKKEYQDKEDYYREFISTNTMVYKDDLKKSTQTTKFTVFYASDKKRISKAMRKGKLESKKEKRRQKRLEKQNNLNNV